jgi:hypothetical protein
MEAATTLPFSRVRTFNGELLIDGLRVDDEAAVELVAAPLASATPSSSSVRGGSPTGSTRRSTRSSGRSTGT